jgi:hypothetical protein
MAWLTVGDIAQQVDARECMYRGGLNADANNSGKRYRSHVNTYNLAFFLGPGFPLILAVRSLPFAVAAHRFTPFFFGLSVGGPMGVCEGVPLAAGVPGLEGEALSSCKAATTGISLAGAGEAEDSFVGDSSFVQDGSRILRSRLDGTRSVTTAEDLPVDFRRSFSLLGAAVLLVGGILSVIEIDNVQVDQLGWFLQEMALKYRR